MNYPLTFRIRLWTRRWFFHPIKSLKTAWYNFKENNNREDLFIKDLDRFLVSHEGDNEGHHRG